MFDLHLDMRQMGAVFRLKYGNNVGSCFCVRVSGNSFLFTARHICRGFDASDRLAIEQANQWKLFTPTGHKFSEDGNDVAVFKINIEQAGGLTEEDCGAPLTIGASVAFLGFPLGLRMIEAPDSMGFPTPFFKSGIFSGANMLPDRTEFLFDAMNNVGFSGGPVYTRDEKGKARIAAIVSGYKYDDSLPVMRKTESGEIGARW